MKASKKLLFIVNVDWFFISHRLPIAIEAVKKGYDVHVACADTGNINEIKKHGIAVHSVKFTRSGTSIIKELKTLLELNKIFKNISPDIVHGVTIKPVLYGSLAARFRKIEKRVFSISGLGYVFIDESAKAKVIRALVSFLYKLGLNNPSSSVIFQNNSDLSVFKQLNIVKESQCRIIRGSGVDLKAYPFTPLIDKGPVVMFLARLLKDKGVLEFCDAAHYLKKQGSNAKFVLVGDLDLHNPNSLDKLTLEKYICREDVYHWGYTNEVAATIAKSTIMVLPSYREGLPKSLIEAAAIGRAVITTDVPGCKDAIEPGITGLLVPAREVKPLAETIDKLLKNKKKCVEMGKAGRGLAEREFDIQNVIAKHFEIYEE